MKSPFSSHINKTVLWMCLLGALVFLPSKAQAMRFCVYDEPNFIVRLAMTKTRYIRTKSSRELTLMSGHRNSQVGGLGGGEIGYKVESYYDITQKNGRYCVGLKNVKVVLYGKPEVHIASNFQKGSCEYTAVLGHEQKHIRTMRSFIREYAPAFKKEVQRISKSTRRYIGPVPEHKIEAAQVELQEDILRQIGIYMNSIIPVLNSRQAEVDSPQEYERVFNKCKNWDRKFSINPK